jgi:hypothetical protein
MWIDTGDGTSVTVTVFEDEERCRRWDSNPHSLKETGF